MNAANWRHTVDVKRLSTSTGADGVEVETETTPLTGVRCLVEPLASRVLEAIIGRIPQARFRMEWGAADIRDNDVVIFQSRRYMVRDRVRDTLRPTTPYQTCILEEIAAQ